MAKVVRPGRQSMGATPARRTLDYTHEADTSIDEEDELDGLDELMSEESGGEEEDELQSDPNGEDDELASDGPADAPTPRPRRKAEAGSSALTSAPPRRPPTTSAAANAGPSNPSKSHSVEAMLDQQAETATSTKEVLTSGPLLPSPTNPSLHFFAGKTFHLAGQPPTDAGAMAEVADVEKAIRKHGGSLVDLNQKPTYVVQIGPVSPMIRVELAKLEPRQVKTLEQFKKLLGKHLLPILSALHSKMAVRSTPGRQQAFPEVSAPAPEPTTAPESEFGREAKLAEEPEKVLFKDKNNLILVFEIQKELPSGIRRYLTDLIEKSGGEISDDLSQVDIRLVDPTSENGQAIGEESRSIETTWRCRPWHWVPASVVSEKIVKVRDLASKKPVFVRGRGGGKDDGEQYFIWVTPQVEKSQELRDLVTACGGRVVDRANKANVVVLDLDAQDLASLKLIKNYKYSPDVRLAPPSWIWESVSSDKRCRLPRPNKAPLAPSAGNGQASDSNKGAGRVAGAPRAEFTNDEDKLLIRYMAAVLYQQDEVPRKGQKFGRTGNRLFEDMCAEDDADDRPWATTHPWQSWRTRYKSQRTSFMDREIDRRIKKLAHGLKDPILDQIRESWEIEPAPEPKKRAPRQKEAPAKRIEKERSAEYESEEIEDPDEGTEVAPQKRPIKRLPKRLVQPAEPQSVEFEDDALQAVPDSQALPPSAQNVPSPTAGDQAPLVIPNPQEDDDDRAGGMDYQPDFDRDLDDIPTEEVPSVAAAVEPSPVPGPVKDALATTGEPGAPAAAIVPSGPVQPSEGLIEAEDEGSDADEEDESGPATQVMRSILAGLSSATPADMDSEDELEASTQPASPEVAGAQDEHMASDDEEDEVEDASGTATLAMQAVLSNTAGPVDPSQGETGEETDELEDEDDAPGAATLAMQVVLSNTSQPIRDAPDDSEDESVTTVMIDRQYPKPSAALPNSAQAAPPSPEGTIDVASRSQTRSPLPQHPTPPPPPPPAEPEPKIEPVVETEPTPARNSSVQKRRRSSARPILRKSLDLPGIGSNIPHYDLGTPSRKKTRISEVRAASVVTTNSSALSAAPGSLTSDDRRAIQSWAVEMEKKYSIERRSSLRFLQPVYPDLAAGESAMFAALPLDGKRTWTAEEDQALKRQDGPVMERLEETVDESVLWRRLRLLRKVGRVDPRSGPHD